MESRGTPLTVAIDGPSGTGKSSVSRAVAQRLGIGYLDTGAMYRALAWWCRHQGIDIADTERVAREAAVFPLRMPLDPADRRILVADEDVTDAIRTPEISYAVSAVAVNQGVRTALRDAQRALIARAGREFGGVVAEGRDLTTVVAPDAPVRILLTASPQARLTRRAHELHGRAEADDVAQVRDQVLARDAIDATVSQFQQAAEGVDTVDSSDFVFEESVAAVLAIVARRTDRSG